MGDGNEMPCKSGDGRPVNVDETLKNTRRRVTPLRSPLYALIATKHCVSQRPPQFVAPIWRTGGISFRINQLGCFLREL